ncbi:uncharacterized protein KY384_003180 [Bacidia gigantensis]|uniref:uncharacterized protein n=1 Tax=Bacidia gigantensis TaxID=2732470 RepID=UPI001D044476|nr:uncharacterized protein KY384_003180 [Bacidia gigantensis]KAG8531550.1 hypothetical protein KY384_003180 [Bacidia gigantensis]
MTIAPTIMSFPVTAQTAYSTVSARRSFAQPPVSGTMLQPPPPSTEKTKVAWPDTVRSYVQRAFAIENTMPDVARQEMEVRLKSLIAESVQAGTLYSIDWASKPLPQQIIMKERQDAAVASVNPPWGNGITPLSLQETNNKASATTSKKRKSSEIDSVQDLHSHVPPWRAGAPRNVFEDRISYADKRHRAEEKPKGLSKSQRRKQRFENAQGGNLSQQPFFPSGVSSPAPEQDQGPVIGRCQDLEKKYFRLTSAPNPDTVRPLPILGKTLEFLKKKWKKENNYSYICDQLKSLRQDLTVQHIKTAFTVSVYELHARIALEKGDLGEYNQCQTQLRALYSQQLGGHPEEFKAYRILYFIHTCNRTDMNDVLADLTSAEKQHSAVKHALETRSALALGNYHRFFQLYLETPNMGAYLMDMFVGRERLVALSNTCIAYKPDVKLRFVTEELGFESDDESARFVCDHGGQGFLDGKEDGEVRLLTSKALRFFEAAKTAAFKTVDIKGQI